MREKRIHIITMGCQMNVYDSEQMLRILAPLNYSATSRVEGADLIILNTCSIREKAEHKVYSLLGRLRYNVAGPVFLAGGYRFDKVDVDEDDVVVDADFSGPFIEAGLKL